jgi:hypothetical protein
MSRKRLRQLPTEAQSPSSRAISRALVKKTTILKPLGGQELKEALAKVDDERLGGGISPSR